MTEQLYLVVVGTIVGRRCLGRNLAFADILIDNLNNGAKHNCFAWGRFCKSIDGDDSAVDKDCGQAVIQVAFVRNCLSTVWREEERQKDTKNDGETGPSPFPTKPSSLPYGARVSLELVEVNLKERMGNKAGMGKVPVSRLEVYSWQVLVNPSIVATRVAARGPISSETSISEQQNSTRHLTDGTVLAGTSANGSFECGDNKRNNSFVSEGGISCSAYLRSRRQTYLTSQNLANRRIHIQCQSKRTDACPPIQSDRAASGDGLRKTIENEIVGIEKDACHCDNVHGHGGKKAKALRAKVFASWLVEAFGAEFLKDGHGGTDGGHCVILDVAGGKGQLSVELSVLSSVQCIIIDPMVRRRAEIAASSSSFLSVLSRKDRKRIQKASAPAPVYLAREFNADIFLASPISGVVGDSLCSDTNSVLDGESLIRSCSCLIALHPDEATEVVVDVALKYNKSFAVVPCCVFSEKFPDRYLQVESNGCNRQEDGDAGWTTRPVRTYDDFVQYLLQKDERLRIQTLPFAGKNKVIYCHCKVDRPQNTESRSKMMKH